MFAAADPVIRLSPEAIRRNLTYVRRLLGRRRLIAVVKEDAYGHGAVPMTRILSRLGVRDFAVGSVEEACDLRNAGIRGSILNMRLFRPGQAREIVRRGILQAVFEPAQVAVLSRAARSMGKRARIQVKIDTGMGRFGIRWEHAASFIQSLRGNPRLEFLGTFSTLTEDTDFDREQIRRLRYVREKAGPVPREPAYREFQRPFAPSGRPLRGRAGGSLLYGFPPREKDCRSRRSPGSKHT